jgi:hypothetical protein
MFFLCKTKKTDYDELCKINGRYKKTSIMERTVSLITEFLIIAWMLNKMMGIVQQLNAKNSEQQAIRSDLFYY